MSGLVGCGEKLPSGKVHITYWEKWSGFEAEAMQRTVDQFNRSQNKIVVAFLSLSSVTLKLSSPLRGAIHLLPGFFGGGKV